MNAKRRSEIDGIKVDLGAIKDRIESVRDDEQEYRDNMPENMQNGDKFEAADTAVNTLEEVLGQVESAIDDLEDME